MDKNTLIDWVKKAQKGDENAFSVLYKQYYPFAYASAYKLTNCEADAKDVVQMSFLQVQKSIINLKYPDYFPLWLHRIVSSKCKDLFRSNRDVTYDDEYFRYHSQAVEERRYMLADKNMHYETDREVFMHLFSKLPEELQESLWLYYFEGNKINEIAHVLDTNENTIKSRMRRGKELLKSEVVSYEKDNNIKLDFRGDVMGAMFATSIFSYLPWKKVGFQQSVVASKGIILMSAIGVASTASIYGIYQEVQKYNAQEQRALSQPLLKDAPMSQAKEAYFKLCNWTFNKDDLVERSKESTMEMRPYYDSLKAEGGEYYQTLVDSGWAETFELLY